MKNNLIKKYNCAISDYYLAFCRQNNTNDYKEIFKIKMDYFLNCFENKVDKLQIKNAEVTWVKEDCLKEYDINNILKIMLKLVSINDLKNNKWSENNKIYYFENYSLFKEKLFDFYSEFNI